MTENKRPWGVAPNLTNLRMVRTLLRKAVFDRRIMVKAFCYAKRSATAPFSSGCILCGSLVKAFCYAKRSIVKILLRKTAYSELCFAKWLRHRIIVKAFCYAKRPSTAPFSSGCILCCSLASAVFAVFDRPVFLRGAYFAVHCLT